MKKMCFPNLHRPIILIRPPEMCEKTFTASFIPQPGENYTVLYSWLWKVSSLTLHITATSSAGHFPGKFAGGANAPQAPAEEVDITAKIPSIAQASR